MNKAKMIGRNMENVGQGFKPMLMSDIDALTAIRDRYRAHGKAAPSERAIREKVDFQLDVAIRVMLTCAVACDKMKVGFDEIQP